MEKKIKKKNNIESNHQEKNQQDQSPINAEIQSIEVKSPGKADEKSDIKLDVKSESEVKSEVKSLGAIYRQKRQESKIEITQASNYLKVRPFDLNAIENDSAMQFYCKCNLTCRHRAQTSKLRFTFISQALRKLFASSL